MAINMEVETLQYEGDPIITVRVLLTTVSGQGGLHSWMPMFGGQ